MLTCSATTRAGRPCRMPVLTGRDVCLAHAPEMRERVEAARRLGGVRKARRVEFDTPAGRRRTRERIAQAVLAGSMTQKRAGIILRALRDTERIEMRLAKYAAQKAPKVVEVRLKPWAEASLAKAAQHDHQANQAPVDP